MDFAVKWLFSFAAFHGISPACLGIPWSGPKVSGARFDLFSHELCFISILPICEVWELHGTARIPLRRLYFVGVTTCKGAQ